MRREKQGPKRPRTEKQLAALRAHAIKPGEVRNPHGVSGKPAGRRFREAIEAAATDDVLRRLAADCFIDDRLRAMIVERFMPKTDRLELGSIGDSEAHEREAAEMRLRRLLDAKGRT